MSNMKQLIDEEYCHCSLETNHFVAQMYRVDGTFKATALVNVLEDYGYAYSVMNTGHVFYILVMATKEGLEKFEYLVNCTPDYKEAVTKLVEERK